MEQEIQLNEHNKAEYPPMHTSKFNTYTSKGIKIIYSKYNQNDEYYKVGHEFIYELLKGFANLSQKYNNSGHNLIDTPYTYRERQLDSLIMPTLSKMCNGCVIGELPTLRISSLKNYEIDNSSGRVDYWCIYNNYSFVIEIKHSYDCFLTNTTRQGSIINRWNEMHIKQLHSIKKDIKLFEEPTKGVIRLGLHFITSYTDKKPNEQDISQYSEQIENILHRIQKDLCQCKPTKTTPNFSGCWIIPKEQVKNNEKTYPGIILMGKIYEPIKHKGSKFYQSNIIK